ncbi:DUF4838 domain-containing protein [Ravibacter arvi]
MNANPAGIYKFRKPGGAVARIWPVLFFVLLGACYHKKQPASEGIMTRGIVLDVNDLSTVDWPKRAKEAGINTIATHVTPSQVKSFIQSEKGRTFLSECEKYGIWVEHELHAMADLLPRELFSEDSTMFRMNEKGVRVGDFNLCVHSGKALDIVCRNVVDYAKVLRSTSGRYFYWIDDGQPMCKCPDCGKFSDSEQALILENRMVEALRKEVDPKATLAHLAYINTLDPPRKIKPAAGVFLEFAPIHRTWEKSISDTAARQPAQISHGDYLRLLDANLEVFPAETAQVLEYWLDVSLFSHWKKPAVQLPWNRDVFLQDLDAYGKRGIRNFSSFAVYMDSAYVRKYPDVSFLKAYGDGFAAFEHRPNPTSSRP